jgi:hypothetical protein
MTGTADKSETYTWMGTTRDGGARTARTSLTPGQLAPIVENYYRKGWRSLRVARGWDMPVANADELVAAIEPSAETGQRTWWSEAPEPWECPRCRCLFERAGLDHEPCH